MLDVEAVAVLLRDTLCVPVLHTVGVTLIETVEDPEVDWVPDTHREGVRVPQELADWEGVPDADSEPVPHAVELTVALELTEVVLDRVTLRVTVTDTVGERLMEALDDMLGVPVPLPHPVTDTVALAVVDQDCVLLGLKDGVTVPVPLPHRVGEAVLLVDTDCVMVPVGEPESETGAPMGANSNNNNNSSMAVGGPPRPSSAALGV